MKMLCARSEALPAILRPADDARGEMFTAFGFLWALTELFHLLSFPSWPRTPLGPPLFLAAILLLLRPSSAFLLGSVGLLSALYVASLQPFTVNHILFNGMVNLSVFLVLARHSRRIHEPGGRNASFDELRVTLRLQVLLLYWLAALHKLNHDFFNSDFVSYGTRMLPVSAAGKLLAEISDRMTLVPITHSTVTMAIWLTLAVEIALPIFLLIPRTRRWALLVGLAFHLVLGLHPKTAIASFSAMVFALYFVFLPDDFLTRLKQWLTRSHWARRLCGELGALLRTPARRVLLGGAMLVAIALALHLRGIGVGQTRQLIRQTFLPYTLVLTTIFVAAAFLVRSPTRSTRRVPSKIRAPALVVPVLIALHSLSPYFGLKTVPTLSMFSNLRTEGDRPNHLFMPASLKVFGYQDDLVEVLATNHSGLRHLERRGLLLPWFEFNRRLHGIRKPFYVKYLRGGKEYELQRQSRVDNSQLEPIPWYLQKLLRFREVDKEGPMRSRW